jgi:hypothetical protein
LEPQRVVFALAALLVLGVAQTVSLMQIETAIQKTKLHTQQRQLQSELLHLAAAELKYIKEEK